MDINVLDAALDQIAPGTAFRIANEALPGEAYFLNQILPERREYDYSVDAANMVVRATMAEHVGMDSPYREGGIVSGNTFREDTAKIANVVRLSEAAQRKLQRIIIERLARRQATLSVIIETYLNFTNKLIVQPHLDTAEFLRARAIFAGKIDWTCDGRRLFVDYGFKADHILPDLTGTNGFGGSTSKFWETIRAFDRLLNEDLRAIVMHSDTIDTAIDNPVNKIEVMSIEKVGRYQKRYRLRRLVGTNERPDTDARYTVELLSYNREAEVVDQTNKKLTKKIKMVQPGEFAAIGGGSDNVMVVGEGSTPEPALLEGNGPGLQVGYTHLAPTVEGDGTPGRYADTYRPEREKWTFEGVGVTNVLPVIPEDDRIVIGKTVI